MLVLMVVEEGRLLIVPTTVILTHLSCVKFSLGLYPLLLTSSLLHQPALSRSTLSTEWQALVSHWNYRLGLSLYVLYSSGTCITVIKFKLLTRHSKIAIRINNKVEGLQSIITNGMWTCSLSTSAHNEWVVHPAWIPWQWWFPSRVTWIG